MLICSLSIPASSRLPYLPAIGDWNFNSLSLHNYNKVWFEGDLTSHNLILGVFRSLFPVSTFASIFYRHDQVLCSPALRDTDHPPHPPTKIASPQPTGPSTSLPPMRTWRSVSALGKPPPWTTTTLCSLIGLTDFSRNTIKWCSVNQQSFRSCFETLLNL